MSQPSVIFPNRTKVEKCLLNTTLPNPFPAPPNRTDFFTNPPKFIRGRTDQIQRLRAEIERSIKTPDPVLVEILGKQGIGKTTLICWIYEMLKNEGVLRKAPMIFLNAMGNPEDFKGISFYRQVLHAYDRAGLLKQLAYDTMSRFVAVLQEKGGACAEALARKFAQDDIKDIISRPANLAQRCATAPENVGRLIDLLKETFVQLQGDLPLNPTFLVTLWSCVYAPSAFDATNAINGTGEFRSFRIATEADAFRAFEDVIALNLWVNAQQSTLIIVFDHLEACLNDQKADNFSTLFSLLLRLRQFTHITIVLSGILDAFDAMEEVLGEDRRLQLQKWARNFSLTPLSKEDVVDVVRTYMEQFWAQCIDQPPGTYLLYPFGENSIKYIYDATQRDLRDTLIRLHDKLEEYRTQGTIKVIHTFFDAIRTYRSRGDVIISEFEQEFFRKELLRENIQDKVRSTMAERALEGLLQILRADPAFAYISDVKHEPPVGAHGEKPDVLVEFFGREAGDRVRKVGIEVKVYRVGQEVPDSDVKKTHVMLRDHKVDYIWWVTNVPLSKAKYALPEDLRPYLGRTAELDPTELAYLSFSCSFQDIYQRAATGAEAKELLAKIGFDVEQIRDAVTELAPLIAAPSASSLTGGITTQPQTALDLLSHLQKKAQDTPSPEPSGSITLNPLVKQPAVRTTATDTETPTTPAPAVKRSRKRQGAAGTAPRREVVELPDAVLEQYLTEIIDSKATQAFAQKKTVFTQLEKDWSVYATTDDEKDRLNHLIERIAQAKGFNCTTTRINFKLK